MSIADLAELSNYAEYKKSLKKDIEKLKVDKRVDIHVIFKLKYSDGKERPAILLGPIAKQLAADLKARSIIAKKGKCTRVDASGTAKLEIRGGIPVARLAPLLKDAGSPVLELIESDEAIDLTTEDPLDDPLASPVGGAGGASPLAAAAVQPSPTKPAEAQARERAEDLGRRARADLGLARPTPSASKAPLATRVRDIDAVGTPAGGAALADAGKAVYQQGSMAAVDVGKQKALELQQTIDALIAEYSTQLAQVNDTIAAYTRTIDDLTALHKQLAAVPRGDAQHGKAQALLVEVEQELGNVKSERSRLSMDFRENVQKQLQKVKAEQDPKKRYAMLMAGRDEDILAVYEQIQKVYADTNRRLVVLGRTADTFKFKEREHDEDRVLHSDNWSIGVNDAFMKAGLDQKAEFAMLTKVKDTVKRKLKELLADHSGRSVEDLIAELRDFVKAEADPALWTGNMKYNQGFAVSMRELEQLLRDGYTMQEFDPRGEEFAGEGAGTRQMMIPKGMGAKIGAELAAAAKARATPTPETQQIEVRWKRLQPDVEKALKTTGRHAIEAQAAAFERAVDPEKIKKQKGALDALEALVAEHLLRPRQALLARLKGLLQSPGFEVHRQDPGVIKLVKEAQLAAAAIDFAGVGALLDRLEASLNV